MREEERKYDVPDGFELPDLSGCAPQGGSVVPRPPKTLRATYYDTADLRLARAGASLRFRRGDAEPWTVKLPTGTPGVRDEISMPGAAATIPDRLLSLVTVLTRGAPVEVVGVLRTVRQAYDIREAGGTVLAEVVDDQVAVLDGRRARTAFREVEVELKQGKPKVLDKVEKVLLKSGATSGEYPSKLVRALGPPAQKPADWPGAPDETTANASAGDVTVAAIRRDIARIVRFEPLVRLHAKVGDNDTAVHQMRVGCRRLRSDLRTFGTVLDRDWTAGLRAELGWLADALGGARDAEVLRERLHHTAAADPLAPLDEAAVERMDAALAARQDAALARLDEAMASQRYLVLLEALLDAANAPRLNRRAGRPARVLLPRLVGKPWRQLAEGSTGAGELASTDEDEAWHAVRIRGKRARYATEAVAGVLGGEAAALAEKLARVQELLGEHQDAAVAAETWLAIAAAEPEDHELAVAAGRLYERERKAIGAAREAFPAAWRAATRRRHTAWLS